MTKRERLPRSLSSRAVVATAAGVFLIAGVFLATTTAELVAGAGAAAASATGPPPLQLRPTDPGTLNLLTVPPMAGVLVQVDGVTGRSDAGGKIAVRVRNFIGLAQRIKVPTTQVSVDRTVTFDRFRGEPDAGVTGRAVELGIRTSRLVSWRFLDRFGGDVPTARVNAMRLRSNTGEVFDLTGPQLAAPQWVPESRTQQGPNGLVSKQLYYVVDSAVVGGASVVNRAQQRFVPWERQQWLVQLLLYKVSFSSGDFLFTDQVGKGIELVRPDGSRDRLPFGADGTVVVPDLPRGTYTVRVYGGGLSFPRPVSISKDQTVSLQVISRVDIGLIAAVVLVAALGLILLGRPHLLSGWRRRSPNGRRPPRRRPFRRRPMAAAAVLLLSGLVTVPVPTEPAYAAPAPEPVPVLAHYYIWFNPTSWSRAKIDYPLLGRYSSDDEQIMRQHVQMAKAAGIGGFMVSWKHTPQLDERLAKLVEVARAESFRLGIVYQGLDFAREPLPFETVAADLTMFADRYATDPVFGIFGKPVVVWTGSARFLAADIDNTVSDVRNRLLVLGDAKSVEEVNTTAPALDGQAYYWSSVDPERASTAKLVAMSRAVHRTGGLWIAPVAPGFDARLVGGAKTVPRRDGDTLRMSFAIARSSEPDAIGVISWNEFSENTHIEPSERYGATDINVLADLLGAGEDIPVAPDSSDPGASHWGLTTWGALVLLTGALALLPLGLALWRRRRTQTAADYLVTELDHPVSSNGGRLP